MKIIKFGIIILLCTSCLFSFSQEKIVLNGNSRFVLKYNNNQLDSFLLFYRDTEPMVFSLRWDTGRVYVNTTSGYTEFVSFCYDHKLRITEVYANAYWSNHQDETHIVKKYKRNNKKPVKCFYYSLSHYPHEKKVSSDCNETTYFYFIIENELNERAKYYEKPKRIKKSKIPIIYYPEGLSNNEIIEYIKTINHCKIPKSYLDNFK